MPIMLETSVQAQFVIPMAISLSFGILFATAITLFLIPSLYMLQIDGFARTRRIMNWFFDRQGTADTSETA
jgi:Cu/Ag efflux pump CusA